MSCRRLTYLWRVLVFRPVPLIAVLQSRVRVGGHDSLLPWTSAVLNDMRSLKAALAPKFDEFGDPFTNYAALVSLILNFPLEWKQAVEAYGNACLAEPHDALTCESFSFVVKFSRTGAVHEPTLMTHVGI